MNNDAANYVVVPTVAMAQMRPRHYGVIALFLLMVMAFAEWMRSRVLVQSGVRLDADALATRDIDLLRDTRKRLLDVVAAAGVGRLFAGGARHSLAHACQHTPRGTHAQAVR